MRRRRRLGRISFSLIFGSEQDLSPGIGKVGRWIAFPKTLLFGKFARTQLRPSTRRSIGGYTIPPYRLRRGLFSRVGTMQSSRFPLVSSGRFPGSLIGCSILTPPPIIPVFALCLSTQGRLQSESISLDSQLVAFVRPRTQLFKHTCLIFGLELLALAAFVEDYGPRLDGQPIWIYMDNSNCLSAMTRGDSNTEAIAILVGRIWGALQRYHISAWFSRVAPKQNPADLPTRAETTPFPAFKKLSFNSLSSIYRLVRKQLKKFGTEPRRGVSIRLNRG